MRTFKTWKPGQTNHLEWWALTYTGRHYPIDWVSGPDGLPADALEQIRSRDPRTGLCWTGD
jgi:hypothetical protein